MCVRQYPFEWENEKASLNYHKHHGAFEEAKTIFEDFLSITTADILHSNDEDRFITIGRSTQQQLIVVAHTDRGEWIRIISARLATQQERKQYERSK